MRGRYYGIVEKYEIPRFQLLLVLLFRRKTMNYSRRIPTMECSKKRKLVVVPFFTDQSVFCDLQEFFRSVFKTYSYICDLNIDVNHNVYSNVCSLLYFRHFLTENILSINLKDHFP